MIKSDHVSLGPFIGDLASKDHSDPALFYSSPKTVLNLANRNTKGSRIIYNPGQRPTSGIYTWTIGHFLKLKQHREGINKEGFFCHMPILSCCLRSQGVYKVFVLALLTDEGL